jgi:hypothetical protein
LLSRTEALAPEFYSTSKIDERSCGFVCKDDTSSLKQ